MIKCNSIAEFRLRLYFDEVFNEKIFNAVMGTSVYFEDEYGTNFIMKVYHKTEAKREIDSNNEVYVYIDNDEIKIALYCDDFEEEAPF